MDHHAFQKQFMLGSHLCGEPMPSMREMKRDLGILKLNGFNLVRLQEHWMADEPLEGQFDFSRYEELIEAAHGLDLGVCLGLTCEQAPGWLYEKYPDCRMAGRDGHVITSSAGGQPGPCFDHPGAQADQRRFITQLVETLGKYENLVVWNTWQEIGYWPEQTAALDVCFCEHTLAAFRAWLDEKYGGLDGLNRAWSSRHADWRYVQPERGAYRQNALPQDVDWRFFMDNVQVAHVLRERAAAIRKADPLKRPIFAHKGAIAIGHAHDWVYARTQDFLGASSYPALAPFHPWDDGAPQSGKSPERAETLLNEMASVAFTFDVIRSSNPPGVPVWAAEFQGGPINIHLHKGRVPSTEDIRRWMLTAVGSGVTGISFRATRAEIMAHEANGFSLLDSTGDSTPRLREAALVGAALNRHADLFAKPSWGGAEVGILVNESNAQFCAASPGAAEHLEYSTRGWHRLLWDLGVPVDFVNVTDASESTAAIYKMLILPFPISLSEENAQKLGEYVYAGGGLVSEVAPGRLDEHGMATRGEISPILANLFGVRQTSLYIIREPGDNPRWTSRERGWGEFLDAGMLLGDGPLDGFSLPASLYIQTYECGGSQPILKFEGRPAGAFRVGRQGWAWLIGTCVGHSALAYRRPETLAFVKNLLAQCKVRPLHKGRLLVRKRSIQGKRAWLFTNPNPEPLTENIWVGSVEIEDLFGVPLERSGDHVSLTVGGLDVRVLVVTKTKPSA